jgi:fumarylacetoacetase
MATLQHDKLLRMPTSSLPSLTTWVELPKHTDFTIYCLPFGVFKSKKLSPRIGMAIGDQVIDLSVLD